MNLYSQYCEYYPDYANCKKWMEENMPDRLEGGTVLAIQSHQIMVAYATLVVDVHIVHS